MCENVRGFSCRDGMLARRDRLRPVLDTKLRLDPPGTFQPRVFLTPVEDPSGLWSLRWRTSQQVCIACFGLL